MTGLTMLDLFSGAHSVGGVFHNRGWRVVSLDINNKNNPTIVGDISEVSIREVGRFGPFDFIWASPPCECFSIASIGHHWHKGGKPKTERAIRAVGILTKTVWMIQKFQPKFWAIENPRGMMRKMDVLNFIPRATVSYCQYGDNRMKPTDIFGLLPPKWSPKMCKNGSPCHEAAPRGSRTGTQGRKTYLDRSAIPPILVNEIAEALESVLGVTP